MRNEGGILERTGRIFLGGKEREFVSNFGEVEMVGLCVTSSLRSEFQSLEFLGCMDDI